MGYKSPRQQRMFSFACEVASESASDATMLLPTATVAQTTTVTQTATVTRTKARQAVRKPRPLRAKATKKPVVKQPPKPRYRPESRDEIYCRELRQSIEVAVPGEVVFVGSEEKRKLAEKFVEELRPGLRIDIRVLNMGGERSMWKNNFFGN